MSCKVSVIIPVYNAKKYLKETAEALLSQSLKEMEFIFVDDCSTDNSANILYEIEKADPERVMIIRLNENQGPGMARNIGIQYASGEYIGFTDSDDLIKKDIYEKLYKKAILGNYDIVECGYYSERKKSEMMLWSSELEGEITLENRVKIMMSCGFLWSKIIKRDLIINSNLEFIGRIPLEDVDFLTRLYLRAQSIGIVNECLYYYRNNEDSFSNKKKNKSSIAVSSIFSEKYIENMKKEPLYDIFKPVIEYVIIGVWFDIYKNYIKGNSSVDKKDVKVIQNKLKQYVPDFHQNIFFVEKAKKDEIKSEFIKL
ncbi:MAG: glycosyltransferase [Clostridium sp.]|uniref:glycosyltransferase family 2 protein n=1 Tax=Clostridium sp. DSM 8431 TaxID=1761781 RepID=UPI0008E0D5EB|nr:glycosyltransferase [Clostridium sp. DSM 8431]MCR4944153.1 glycosyltransferase [Clostridium sp.]SFU83821.1 Glycosyltransferase involved in cell wall bisynthesis [Clostridium sp. DSM 8431]